jgi:chaperonin GroEL (HSP60 family)
MEMKNKKYKIEDALNATRAAVEEGIVVGGTALVKLSKKLDTFTLEDTDEQIGVEIIKHAIVYPVIQIANNAGYKGDRVVEKVKEDSDFNQDLTRRLANSRTCSKKVSSIQPRYCVSHCKTQYQQQLCS